MGKSGWIGRAHRTPHAGVGSIRRWAAALVCVFGLLAGTPVLAQDRGTKVAAAPVTTALPDSPVLRKLRATGVVNVGYRTASAPFSYLDARLKPVGYSIDLCDHVVEALRTLPGLGALEIRHVPVSSSTRLPLVANGTVDLECGATTNNAERQRTVAFSVTTFVAEARLLSKKATGIRTIDDLRGRLVATTIGTTSVQYMQVANQERGLDMRLLLGLDDMEAFQHVESGRAAAFAMDDVLLTSVLSTAPDPGEWTISAQALSVEPYGIGMLRTDPVFKQVVDDALIRLYRSNTIHEIYKRWFMSPIPPRGANLQLPMSSPLARVIANPTDSPDPSRYR
jgi:glutamate/aspartate transport system substrate-binding protein